MFGRKRILEINNHNYTGNVVIEGEHVKKTFGDKVVLRDFNFKLLKGENLVVLGRSGTGKSVLIKCIAGLMSPDGGTIRVFGKDIMQISRMEMDKIRLKMGFVFQRDALYDSMTVRENLEFPLKEGFRKHADKEEINKLIIEILESVGLAEAIDLMPSELSGGMRKRIGLARALMLKPPIMLYDEPTSGLDPITGREISRLINHVQKFYNTSSIIITHDISCVKIAANRIIILKDGICFAENDFENLQQSEDAEIHQFFE